MADKFRKYKVLLNKYFVDKENPDTYDLHGKMCVRLAHNDLCGAVLVVPIEEFEKYCLRPLQYAENLNIFNVNRIDGPMSDISGFELQKEYAPSKKQPNNKVRQSFLYCFSSPDDSEQTYVRDMHCKTIQELIVKLAAMGYVYEHI